MPELACICFVSLNAGSENYVFICSETEVRVQCMSAGMVYHCICAVLFCLRCSLLILGHLMTVSTRLLVKLQESTELLSADTRFRYLGHYCWSSGCGVLSRFVASLMTCVSVVCCMLMWQSVVACFELLSGCSFSDNRSTTIFGKGHAMASVVRRRLLTEESRVQSQGSRCSICGRRSGIGTAFLRSSSVPPCRCHPAFAPHLSVIDNIILVYV